MALLFWLELLGHLRQRGRLQYINDDIATRASRVLSLPIYGGDAIITPDGNIHLIDFNDWPSFSSCRDEAAKAIAKRITK